MNKQFKVMVRKNKLPITLLFMRNTVTKNTIIKITPMISYENGEKIITHDFYKYISTY